nr:PREDICTED: uncharacterized protein LOC109039075 [Bemisia tabaci]
MSERKQGETKKQRMSEAQKTHLITYMVDHSYFAKHGVDPGPNGSDAGAKRWQKLTNELNAIGAATKDASGWKQTWSDMKLRIKKIAAGITNLPTGNSGKPPKKLKPEEELVYHLCGGKDFIGAGTEEELGIALATQQQPQPALDDDADYSWLPPPPPELVREGDEESEDADMPDEQTDTYITDTETIEFDFPELGIQSITLPTSTAPKNSVNLSCQRTQRNNNPEKEQVKSMIPPEIPPKTPQSTPKPAPHSLPSCSKENGMYVGDSFRYHRNCSILSEKMHLLSLI